MTLRRFRQTSKVCCFNCKETEIPYSDKSLATSLTSYYFRISAKHGLPKERTTRSDKREQYWHSREQAEGLQCNWSPSNRNAIHYMSKPVHQNRKAHIARQNTFILDTDTQRLVNTSACTSCTCHVICTQLYAHDSTPRGTSN